MPLISVVIPVHGVADYLDRCLDSVLSEAATSLEVIAVDDASPDGSGAILAARHDPRLRVISTPAAVGPGPARDLGAKEATGEYVWFVDGDDELAEGALAAVAGALTRLHPDLLIIDFENLYPDGTTSPSGGARYLSGHQAGPRGPSRPGSPDHDGVEQVFRRDFLGGLGISFGRFGVPRDGERSGQHDRLADGGRSACVLPRVLSLPPGAPRVLPGRRQRRQLQYLRLLQADL